MSRNVAEVLDLLTAWEREGAGVIGVCPSHADGHPSLRIDVKETGQLLIFCRAGCSFGDVLDSLVGMGLKGIGGPWAWPEDLTGVGQLSEETGTLDDEDMDDLEALVAAANKALDRDKPDGGLALDYIADRFDMSPVDADELRLGLTSKGGVEWWPIKRSWLQVARLFVPFLDWAGVPRGGQARALTDHEVRWTGLANGDDGANWAKVGYFRRDDGLDHAVVTEGPSDGLTAYGQGYTAVVVRGAALAQSDDVLAELAENLSGYVVSVVGDRDAAGDAFRERMVEELRARGLDARPLLVPEPHGDLNDWFTFDPQAFGTALHKAIRGAVPLGTATAGSVWDSFSWAGCQTNNAGAAEITLWWMRETGRDLVYIRGYNAVVFDDGKWWPGHEHRLRHVLQEARRSLLRWGSPEGDVGRQIAHGLASKLGQTIFRDAVLKEFPSMVDELDADALDAREELLLVANGVVNLRTGDLLEATPDMLLSTRLEVAYEPDAEAPRWERFVAEIMCEDDSMAAFMKRLLGYGITGSTREQCFSVFYGLGANGKTVLMEALSDVFGPIVKTVPFSLFEAGGTGGGGPSPELARLRGNRLTLTSEGEAGAPIREALVKSMTGSDTIAARHLYQEEIEFRPRHLILMASNHAPIFHGADEGLWRRVKLIPFKRYFAPDERDHYLNDKLRAEAEGILTWAVQGAREWFKDGLKEPDIVKEATAHLRLDSDLLAGFYPGHLVDHPGGRVKLALAYKAWEDFADEQAEKAYSSRWLGRELETRGVVKRKLSATYLIDVRLTTEAERVALYEEEA